jgi:hypothetical protein
VKYALLIYTDAEAQAEATEQQLREMYAAYGSFTEDLQRADKLGPAAELQAARTAKSVRLKDGQTLVTDGPYADTREQLGGIYIIDCADMDEAITWAARVPSATYGTIEVRPLASGDYPEAG